jgi:hypothetical protein
LLSLSQRVGTGNLEIQSATEISARVLQWIGSRRNTLELELKRLNADAANGDQVVRIEGGLPDLPGTQIIMPDFHAEPEILPPERPTASSLGPLTAIEDVIRSAATEPLDPADNPGQGPSAKNLCVQA